MKDDKEREEDIGQFRYIVYEHESFFKGLITSIKNWFGRLIRR